MSGKKPIDKLREMMQGVHSEEDIIETIFKVLENHEKRLQSIEEQFTFIRKVDEILAKKGIFKDTKP